MKLLIVDDEKYVIDSIKMNLNLELCSVEQLYTAFSVKQAQAIMELVDIDVIITDIVMPEENGFDFIGWIRENKYDVSVIFLTSYAEFNYAQRAIALESVDYLLKPIDYEKLTKSLCIARDKQETARELELYKKEKKYWERNKAVFRREFWRSALSEGATWENLTTQIEEYHLGYEKKKFYLLYISFFETVNGKIDKWILYYELEQELQKLLAGSGICMEAVLPVEKRSCLFICGQKELDDSLKWCSIFDILIQKILQKYKIDIWCGATEMKQIIEFSDCISRLIAMRDNSLSVKNKVLYLQSFIRPEFSYENPNIELWKTLLEEQKKEELLTDMQMYLENVERTEMLTRQILESFRIDVTQMVYAWLTRKEIKAHLLFSKLNTEKFDSIIPNISGIMEYVSVLIHEAISYERYVHRSASVTEKIKNYIDAHYREEIRRDVLAEMVFLNTDYMSRIFKKEFGVSISTYLLQKRVEEAKKLLSQSTLPINTVSIYVGYSNFSYFTKMFKENTGYSPLEYRRKFTKG